jgi:hypothetical protein
VTATSSDRNDPTIRPMTPKCARDRVVGAAGRAEQRHRHEDEPADYDAQDHREKALPEGEPEHEDGKRPQDDGGKRVAAAERDAEEVERRGGTVPPGGWARCRTARLRWRRAACSRPIAYPRSSSSSSSSAKRRTQTSGGDDSGTVDLVLALLWPNVDSCSCPGCAAHAHIQAVPALRRTTRPELERLARRRGTHTYGAVYARTERSAMEA